MLISLVEVRKKLLQPRKDVWKKIVNRNLPKRRINLYPLTLKVLNLCQTMSTLLLTRKRDPKGSMTCSHQSPKRRRRERHSSVCLFSLWKNYSSSLIHKGSSSSSKSNKWRELLKTWGFAKIAGHYYCNIWTSTLPPLIRSPLLMMKSEPASWCPDLGDISFFLLLLNYDTVYFLLLCLCFGLMFMFSAHLLSGYFCPLAGWQKWE